MARRMSENEARRNRELMLRVAREPRFRCCCVRLSKEDRRRARRVFRFTRRLTRAWEKERKAQARARNEARST